jgi:hypothetical protein
MSEDSLFHEAWIAPLLLADDASMKEREKTMPPQGQPRLTEAVERLVQLYETTRRKDKAARWRKELEACKSPSPPE